MNITKNFRNSIRDVLFGWCALIIMHLFFILLIYFRERMSKQEQRWKEQRERETEREFQAGSTPGAEPDVSLHFTTLRLQPEIKSGTLN